MRSKHILVAVAVWGIGLVGAAQSADVRIGEAMNRGDWFGLDSLYEVTPKDSIHPFFEVFSRCLLGNRFNRPDVSLPAFKDLLNNHSESLGLHNLLNSSVMYAMDLGKTGDNAMAASVLGAVLDATREHLDSAAIAGMQRYVDQYAALAPYKPYSIEFGADVGRVPFSLVPVGKPSEKSVLMRLGDAKINGLDAAVTFDTGAGVNIISHDLAARYGLVPLDATNTVRGIGRREGGYAIAKELVIGNITIRDVPFLVMDISTTNEEADKFTDVFSIMVGGDLMLRLKDVTVDFVNKEITVPSAAPERTSARPNMVFSSEMNLLTKGSVLGEPMLMVIDTGDASFGSLSPSFFKANEAYVKAHAELDSIRMAGIAGVAVSPCYRVPDMPVMLGGNVVSPKEFVVLAGGDRAQNDYECTVGVKTLMLFGKVRFNMVDFVVSTEPPSSMSENFRLSVPKFNYVEEKNPNAVQTLGFIAVGIVNVLVNPNAPTMPDM